MDHVMWKGLLIIIIIIKFIYIELIEKQKFQSALQRQNEKATEKNKHNQPHTDKLNKGIT